MSQPPASDDLVDWDLLPTRPDWAGGLRDAWEPGEPAARARLRTFLHDDIGSYDRARDEPSAGATSLLSPRLRWGELSPFTVWHAAVEADGAAGFLSELGWREFAWHTTFHAPDIATKNLRRQYDAFPWPRLKPSELEAWQRGDTGIPLVDAGYVNRYYPTVGGQVDHPARHARDSVSVWTVADHRLMFHKCPGQQPGTTRM